MTSFSSGGSAAAKNVFAPVVNVLGDKAVTVTTVSTLLLAADDNRTALRLDNRGNKDVHLSLGTDATLDDIVLEAGASSGFLVSTFVSSVTEAVSGIVSAGSSDVIVFEVTTS